MTRKLISLILILSLILSITSISVVSVNAINNDCTVGAETLNTTDPLSMIGKSKQAIINTYGSGYITQTLPGGGLTPYISYRNSTVPYVFGLDGKNNIFVVIIYPITSSPIKLFDELTNKTTYNQILNTNVTHYYHANDNVHYDSYKMSIGFYYTPYTTVTFDWTTTNKNAIADKVTIHKTDTAHYPDDLPAPKLKSAVSTSNGIKITWGKVQYAEKYRVFYKGSNGSWKRLGDTVNTSFVDDDVKSGSTYTYTVRPINSAGDVYTGSFDSNGISATYNPPMLARPQITGFESTSDGVKIKWNRVSNAYGYRVFYKGRNGWKGMGNTTETFFVDTDVSDEVTYTYTVRCIDKSGNFVSDYNNNGWNYTYLLPQLSTPQITKFESTAEGVKITWNKVSGAYGYRVFYLGRDGWKSMGNTTGNTFVDDDVRDGGTYTYTVRCIGQNGNFTSRYNTNGWKYTYVKPQLATPQITKFESTFDGVKITWNKVANAYGYRVFYLGRDGWKSMGNTTGNTFVDDDVRDGGTYTYTVRCINANGDFVSRYNTNGWKYTYRVPWLTTPQIASLKSTDNGVEIKWNKVSGAAQYRVFYKGANGSWKRLATTAATSFTDDDVRSGSTYTYTVRCVDASGEIYTSLYDNAGKSIKFVNAKADYIDKLMDTIDSWSFEDYRGMVAQSGFTFMDLDFDGVNEFIVQREGGTMRNFDAVVYTYKNGKVVKVPANEEFIQNNNFQYFYNTSTKKYLIVGTAVCAEGTVNNRKIYNYSLTYANNRITSDYYSACFVNVAWRSPSGKDEYHYYNGADGYYKGIGNHKEITEVQYNTISSNKLKNCVDCNMKRKFVIQYEWNTLSKAEKRRQMLDAYNAFTYTKH